MDPAGTSDRAINAVRDRLTGQEAAGVRIDGIFSYGAVDLDPRHLVVWVLLSGRPDAELPEWYFPAQPGAVTVDLAVSTSLDTALQRACLAWAEEIRSGFADWPHRDEIRVGFDSTHRVEEQGGWRYFK